MNITSITTFKERCDLSDLQIEGYRTSLKRKIEDVSDRTGYEWDNIFYNRDMNIIKTTTGACFESFHCVNDFNKICRSQEKKLNHEDREMFVSRKNFACKRRTNIAKIRIKGISNTRRICENLLAISATIWDVRFSILPENFVNFSLSVFQVVFIFFRRCMCDSFSWQVE